MVFPWCWPIVHWHHSNAFKVIQKNLSNPTLNGGWKVSNWEVIRLHRWLLAYLNMVTVPHKMVGLERMSDYRGFTVQTGVCCQGRVAMRMLGPTHVGLQRCRITEVLLHRIAQCVLFLHNIMWTVRPHLSTHICSDETVDKVCMGTGKWGSSSIVYSRITGDLFQ
jgi:hypothetical protein